MKILLVILVVSLMTSFATSAHASCKNEVASMAPLFSAAERHEVELLESYRRELQSESKRALYAEKMTEEEFQEILAREDLPQFVEKEEAVKVYVAHLEFLLKGIDKKIGSVFIKNVMAKIDAAKVLGAVTKNLEPWVSENPEIARLSEDDLRAIVDMAALRFKDPDFSEDNLAKMLSLKMLLNVASKLSSEKRNVNSDLTILTSAVQSSDEKQILATVRQNSSRLLVPAPQDQNLIAFVEPQLVQLKTRYEQIEKALKQLDVEFADVGARLSLFDPTSRINAFGQIYGKMAENDHKADNCCNRGCSDCGYKAQSRTLVYQKTAKLYNLPSVIPADTSQPDPTLAFYRAKRDLATLLPQEIFNLHQTPKDFQRLLDSIN